MLNTIFISKYLDIEEQIYYSKNEGNLEIIYSEHSYYIKLPPLGRIPLSNPISALMCAKYYNPSIDIIDIKIPNKNINQLYLKTENSKYTNGIKEIASIIIDFYKNSFGFINNSKLQIEYYENEKICNDAIIELVDAQFVKIEDSIKYGIKYSELLDILNSNPFFVLEENVGFCLIEMTIKRVVAMEYIKKGNK